VAVVGEEVGVGDLMPAAVGGAIGIADEQCQKVAGERGVQLGVVVHFGGVVGGFDVPPFAAEVDDGRAHSERCCTSDERAAAAGGVGSGSGNETGFASGGHDDADDSEDEN